MRIVAVIIFFIVVAAVIVLFAEPDRPLCTDFLAADISGCDISHKDSTK